MTTCRECVYGASEEETDTRGTVERWACYIDPGEPSCRAVNAPGLPAPPACRDFCAPDRDSKVGF